MQKPPCEPTAEISVCVNCIEEDKGVEGTETPGHAGYSDEDNNNTGYSDEDDNLNEEDVGGAENTESPDWKSHMIVDDNLHNGEGR